MDGGYRDFFVHLQVGRSGVWEAVGQCQSAHDTWQVIFPDPNSLANKVAAFEQCVGASRDAQDSRNFDASGSEEESVYVSDPELFGEELFNALLPAHSLYRPSLERSKQEGKRLRIRLSVEDLDKPTIQRLGIPELSTIPWEFLYDPVAQRHVAVRTPLLRHARLPTFARPMRIAPPLRILGVVASPDDLGSLNVEAEMKRVKEELADLPGATVEWLEHATYRKIMNMLRPPNTFHILHYIGHGDTDAGSGEGLIALEKDDGSEATHELYARQLSDLLEGHTSLRLCVLNSCNGSTSSTAAPFANTAATLIKGGLSAVIAMQYEIGDEAAVGFSRALYAALADGLHIDEALCEARVAMRAERRSSLEWGTPVLHMQSPDGALFDLTGSAQREPVEVRSRKPAPDPVEEQVSKPVEAPMPDPIDEMLRTDDSADLIRVISTHTPGEAGVKLCFELGKKKMWWKGLGFGSTPTPKLEGEGHGSLGCLTTVPGPIQLYFWKAKMFGVHTQVGRRTIDLSSYNEHQVTFTWLAD